MLPAAMETVVAGIVWPPGALNRGANGSLLSRATLGHRTLVSCHTRPGPRAPRGVGPRSHSPGSRRLAWSSRGAPAEGTRAAGATAVEGRRLAARGAHADGLHGGARLPAPVVSHPGRLPRPGGARLGAVHCRPRVVARLRGRDPPTAHPHGAARELRPPYRRADEL